MARKICVVIGSRANYGSIKSAMQAIQKHLGLELQVIAGASALLDKYGSVVNFIEKDGFNINERIYTLIEGETLSTMAKSTGLGIIELPTIFERLKPDVVLTVGDRFETMATAIAASYLNIPLAHTMGGEVSGTIDEKIRHAITKLADIHFPACEQAKERIIKMGESHENVHLVGCPRIDLISEILKKNYNHKEFTDKIFKEGVGRNFDLSQSFLLVSQHSVTTEYGKGEQQINETLCAVKKVDLPSIWLWPNADAGSEDIARGIRKFREYNKEYNIRFFKNLPNEDYIQLMSKTVCLVGNSSSAIREGAYIGTPAVNIGSRQHGRQRGENVIDVNYNANEIADAILRQLNHGRYASESIYGEGHAGERIADILSKCNLSVNKRMSY